MEPGVCSLPVTTATPDRTHTKEGLPMSPSVWCWQWKVVTTESAKGGWRGKRRDELNPIFCCHL